MKKFFHRKRGFTDDISMVKLNDSESFWSNGEGISVRLEILCGAINKGSYNNALQVCALCMVCNTSRCQVRSQNANTVFDIMGASIGKACLCPSFLHTSFALIFEMCGFLLQNPSLQHSEILPLKLKVMGSGPFDPLE